MSERALLAAATSVETLAASPDASGVTVTVAWPVDATVMAVPGRRLPNVSLDELSVYPLAPPTETVASCASAMVLTRPSGDPASAGWSIVTAPFSPVWLAETCRMYWPEASWMAAAVAASPESLMAETTWDRL